MKATPAKSFTESKGSFCRTAAFTTMVPEVVEQSVWPSGAARMQVSMPRMPSAPTRLSISTVRPKAFDSGSSMPRVSVSLGTPGGLGTTTRKVAVGNDWARAALQPSSAPTRMNSLNSRMSPPLASSHVRYSARASEEGNP
jgi:hypothetical protein